MEGGRSAELGIRQTVFVAANIQHVCADERRERVRLREGVAHGKRYTIRVRLCGAGYMHI